MSATASKSTLGFCAVPGTEAREFMNIVESHRDDVVTERVAAVA